jgi:hypothetical protein
MIPTQLNCAGARWGNQRKTPHSRSNFMKDLAYMETYWQFWGGRTAIYPQGLSIDEPYFGCSCR